MKYKESDFGVAKYDDSGKLIGVYEKSSPEVKEWRQQQSIQQRRSSNTTTKKKDKYVEPAGPKPKVDLTTAKNKPWEANLPEYYTTADEVVVTQPASKAQADVQGPRPQVTYPQYNRPWEANLPEIARPGLQLQRADEAVQPGLAEARSIRRGQNIVDQIASEKNDTYFRTAETIQNLNARKENINDFYKKVDQLGIDGAINWYNKEVNPYGMERYDEFTERTNQAEKESPRVFYKTIGELAEAGKGGNVHQYHEWKNRVNFGDTEGERLRVALDVGNLSGDKLDKYYETLYNDGLNAATDYAMAASGYTAVPPQINEAEIQNEYVRLYQTSGQEAADNYLSSINDWYNSEYQKSYQDAFDRYVNDSINNTDFDSDEYTFARQIKGSAGKDRAFYEKRLDTINDYEYMMENDPERERKIRAGENKTLRDDFKDSWYMTRPMAEAEMKKEELTSEMNQKELDTFNYLKGKSTEEAREYLDAWIIKTQINRTAKQKLAAYEFGKKHKKLGTIADIGASTFAGMVSLPQQVAQVIHEAAGGEHVPTEVLAANNPLLTVKGAMAQGVQDSLTNPADKFLYGAGVSIFNNVAGVLLYNKYYPLVMTLNAAGESTHQGLERGLSKEAALFNGSMAGAIEYLTEKMFFDDIMDVVTKPLAKNSTNIVRNLFTASLKNAGSEFGEEAVGALTQNAIDAIVAGDKSQFNAIVNKNIAEGMSKDDAARDAALQMFVLEPLQNGIAGAVSGAVLGGGYHYSTMTQYGGEVVNSNIGDAVLTRALSAPEGSNTKKIAVQIADDLKSGKRIDNYSYGNLYAAMKEDGVKLTDEDMTTTDKVNNLYLKDGGGVAGTVAASRLDWAQYQYLDELGKATGKNFVIQDFVEVKTENGITYDAANGLVNSNDNNIIYISANSENPLLATAKHELTHTLEQTASGKEFIGEVIKQIKKQDINGYNNAVEKQKALYASAGKKISDPQAENEIAADAAWKMLSRYTDVAALANKDVRLAKKIKGVVVDLLNAINGSNAKMEGVSGAVYDGMTKEQLQNIKRNFEMALGEDVAVGDANTATTTSNANMPQGIGTEATISEMETVQPITNPTNTTQANGTPDITQVLSRGAQNRGEAFVKTERNIIDVLANKNKNSESVIKNNKGKTKTEPDITEVLSGKKWSFKNNPAEAEATISEMDKVYMDAVRADDTETAQRMVDEAAERAGYTVKAYHGTSRGDRVGTVFRADRATSGPMAYFTSDKEIASNYARDKADTSLAYDEEYNSYYTQFRVNRNGKNISIPELWKYLDISEKNKIRALAGQIKFDDDYENIIVDKTAKYGNGAYDDYTLNMHKGNVLEALVDTWLETGDLYRIEADFLKVLELVGIKDAEYRDPDARHEKVYDTWLKIQNPFDTKFANEKFYNSLSDWIESHDMSVYEKETANADMWDKNNQTPETWLEKLADDIENGTTHAWTVIPDFVTDYLREHHYDGIKDKGGKNGGDSHVVWIPFSSEQIKSADPIVYDDNGNIIPLSERFNAGKVDIRYSLKNNPTKANVNYAPTFYSKMGKVIDEIKQDKIGANSVVSYLKGKGVKNEEIKWSGIEAFLDGKKSVTKAELQEFVAGSMLQIEEITLDDNEIPYTQRQQTDVVFWMNNLEDNRKRIAELWRESYNEELPEYYNILSVGDNVRNLLREKLFEAQKNTPEWKALKKAEAEIKDVIKRNDYFGYDNFAEAYESLSTEPEYFYEHEYMSDSDKDAVNEYAEARKAFKAIDIDSLKVKNYDLLQRFAERMKRTAARIRQIQHKRDAENKKYKPKWGDYKLDGGDNYREIIFKMPDSTYTNNAMSAHWAGTATDAQGVLAHARIQDFYVDGKKMLFIEEIQSDWHNAGQKWGYRQKGQKTKRELIHSENDAYEKFWESHLVQRVTNKLRDLGYDNSGTVVAGLWGGDTSTYRFLENAGIPLTNDEKAHLEEQAYKWKERFENAAEDESSPDAPFRDNYHEYVLKRLIRMAAEQGYDSIGWTTADIQSDRWSDEFAEGYRIEYDQDIPKFLNKYGKKWGAKVGETILGGGYEISYEEGVRGDGQIYSSEEEAIAALVDETNSMWGTDFSADNVDVMYDTDSITVLDGDIGEVIGTVNITGGGEKVWSMDITESMKESVLYEGQTLYSLKNKPTEANVNMSDKANTNVAGDVEEQNITNVLSKEEQNAEEKDITKVLSGRNAELEAAVKNKGEYSSDNEIADEDYPDWFFGTPTPTDADAPPVIAQTETERMLTEMRDAIFKVVGKKITYDNTEIRNIAKNFKKMYNSRASIEKVSTAIAEAYKAVAEVQNAESEDIDLDKIKNMIDLSEKAARVIIDSSDSIDRTLWDANKPVRDFIRQNVFKVNESIKRKFPEGGYNSFAEFLKANRGSIRISYTKGTPVDTLYNELVNNFPEWFTNAPSSAEEQLVWIADVLQDMRSTLVQDESGLTYDDKVQMLGSDILSVYTDAVFDIGTQQNIISEIERRKRDSIKRYYSEKYQDKIERDKERRQASEDRKKLLRIAKWLKNKRTSEYYREQIDELIHNLDTESIGFIKKGYDKVVKNPDGTETVTHVMDRLDIEKLAEEYNKLKEENPNFIVNTGVERKIARLRNVQIADMSIEEVRDLIDVLSNLQTEIMNSDRLIKSKRAERASKIAHDTKKRLEVVKGTGDNKLKISFDAYITGHVGAVAAARKFMGYQKNSSFVGVVEELNDGQREMAKIQQEANTFFDNFLKDKKNIKFLENLDKKYTDYGNGVVITSGMRISLALLARNKNAAEHIQGGGMTIPNRKLMEKGNVKEAYNKGKTIQITQEQLIKIVKDITPQERQFAYLVDKLMNEYSKKKINETSLELYGYELANVTNYFPIRTNKVFIGTEVDNLSQSGTLEGMGILKERKPGAYTPIVLESVMDVVNRHINDVSKFAGMAIPLRNFKLVYGSASYVPTFEFDNSRSEKLTSYSSVQHSLTKTWGSHAKDYFDHLIQDIDSGRQVDNTYSKILDTITGNVAKSALVMNLSTVLKQSAAYPTAGAVLGFGPLAKGLLHHVSAADKALYNRITPVIWLREKGYSMREISDYMEGSSIEKKVPALLGWIQQSDVAISYKICKAAEMYVNSHYNYKKGSKQWENALADTINKAIEKTQQSSTTMQRAAILRSPNSLVKAFNMFKSQSYLQTELLLDAVGEYNAWRRDKKAGRNITDKDIAESRRRLANVISAQVVASTMMGAIEIVWRAISAGDKEWEDEEGKFRWSNLLKNFFKRIIFNIAGQVEFGTEVSDIVYAALTGDRYYGVDVASAGLISDMGEAVVRGVSRAEETIDTIKNKKYFDWHEEIMPIEKDLEKLLAIFGVPLANVRKVIQTGYNTVLSAAEKVKPGSTERFQKNIKTVLYGSTAVFNDEKSAAYKELKTNMGERQAEQNARKYSKTYDVMKAFKDYAAKNPSKKKEIQENMKKYADYIKTFDLPDDIRKMYDDLYVELEKEYGREEANKTLPLYTPTSELSIEYGGETIKYKLSADEYNDYLYKLIEADTEVYKQLASDPYFAEQSAEVKLKMLKRARDAKVNEVETAIVEEKKGFTEEQQKAQRTKQYNAVTEFKGTAGKDYVKLDDIYYEVSPETYQKYTEYVNSNINNIMSALESGTPLNRIKGFEKTYFMQNNKRVKPNQAFSSYGVVIQEKIKNKVKDTVKDSFLTDIKKQNATQAAITQEILSSKYKYYKSDEVLKNIDGGDFSQNVWVRTDGQIVKKKK